MDVDAQLVVMVKRAIQELNPSLRLKKIDVHGCSDEELLVINKEHLNRTRTSWHRVRRGQVPRHQPLHTAGFRQRHYCIGRYIFTQLYFIRQPAVRCEFS